MPDSRQSLICRASWTAWKKRSSFCRLVLFCISPSPHGNKFQPELLFLSPKFHSFKSKPLCLSLLLYLLLVSMVTPLSALYTIYLSLRFPLCLSHSVLIFLILLSSLPPFLLLYPTPSSLWLLSLFTFICLSPFSPLQACHSIMLFFSPVSYLWRAREKFHLLPYLFCIFNHFPCFVSTGTISHLHVC